MESFWPSDLKSLDNEKKYSEFVYIRQALLFLLHEKSNCTLIYKQTVFVSVVKWFKVVRSKTLHKSVILKIRKF